MSTDWIALGGAAGAVIETDAPVALCVTTAAGVTERASAAAAT
jgi:hypothetical protein